MTHFVKWSGPNYHNGAPRISKTIQTIDFNQAFKFGVWGLPDGLEVGPNDPSFGVTTRAEAVVDRDNDITWFDITPRRSGNVLVDIRDSGGASWDMFQLAVRPQKSAQRPTLRGIDYDVTLDTKGMSKSWNASLKVTLRIHFKQINPKANPFVTDTSGFKWYTQAWTAKEWNAFIVEFIAQAKRSLNEKFWLKAPSGISELSTADDASGATFISNLHCQFDIVPVWDPKGAHQSVEFTKIPKTPPGTLPMLPADSTHMNNMVIYKIPSSSLVVGVPGEQHRVPHEVRHLLGLHHVFEGMAVDANAQATANPNYCRLDSANNPHPGCMLSMGVGDGISILDAKPWQKAAVKWFKALGKGYNFADYDFPPSMTRVVPYQK